MFTDGSREDENNGYAVIFSGKEFSLKAVSSVFFCEAYAVRSPLEIIKNSTGSIMLSDSTSALYSLQQDDANKPIIQNLFFLLFVCEFVLSGCFGASSLQPWGYGFVTGRREGGSTDVYKRQVCSALTL